MTSAQKVVAVALVLTGLSMRTAVTSVGAVLDDVEHGLHTGSGVAGVITTLPVICFAVIGATAPRLSGRIGSHLLLVAALVAMTCGLVLRALSSDVWLFLVLSVLALTGGAVANVLLPSLVKQHFPERIGPMTAVYTTALAVGTTLAAGLTVPIGNLAGSHEHWRVSLGSWALLSAVGILPWLSTLRHDRSTGDPARLPLSALRRSRTAWLLMLFFGFQSMQAYVAFGWYERFLHAHGIPESTAGWMVALFSALGVPVSAVAPSVPARHHRALVMSLAGIWGLSYLGLGIAPVGGAWVWMVLGGIGSGLFPVVLAMIGLRSRDTTTTATLSAFVQCIGYVIAGLGPLLFGVLYGATHAWVLPLALLWVALAVTVGCAWFAAEPRFVDDEMAASAS